MQSKTLNLKVVSVGKRYAVIDVDDGKEIENVVLGDDRPTVIEEIPSTTHGPRKITLTLAVMPEDARGQHGVEGAVTVNDGTIILNNGVVTDYLEKDDESD